MSQDARLFDLNIEKILEAWDNGHAVRELIANALDEQVLSGSGEIEIGKASDVWSIRDFGRGLRYEHFTQNENPEKLTAIGRVIGKFGVGLKDALATLDRNGIRVELESKHAVITLAQQSKHDFGDIVTLHAVVAPPRDANFVGTAVRLKGLPDEDMEQAKSFFLRFSGEETLEETRIGQILAKRGSVSRIYVAGLLIAEEENFAFSYNIISLTEAMKKALNRERTNVGRTAYSERVKAMLLQAKNQAVAKVLASQMRQYELGTASDEVNWKDVAVHACKILNATGSNVFVTSSQLSFNASVVDHARDDGHEIIVVPDTIYNELSSVRDVSGAPIRDLAVYQQQWNDTFKFKWVNVESLTAAERAVFDNKDKILSMVGGLPSRVKAIRVSETMRMDFGTGSNALGLWDSESASIVIRRDQLASLRQFGGVLLHEIAHARSGCDDVTRGFENELTELLGVVVTAAASTSPPPAKRSFWR